jgi:hypothetical protein
MVTVNYVHIQHKNMCQILGKWMLEHQMEELKLGRLLIRFRWSNKETIVKTEEWH